MRLKLMIAACAVVLASCSSPTPPAPAASAAPESGATAAVASPESGATAAVASPAPAVSAPASAAAAVPADFQVRTNEPFWSARVQGDTLTLSSPDGQRTLKVESNEAGAGGRDVTARDDEGTVKVHATVQPCQDTMKGDSFPFTGTLTIGDAAPVSGCGLPL